MANPQVEDGHIDIANEIAEALCRINLSAYESRVLWALFRKTYGWHKKSDRISYTQWEELTGLNRWHIARTLQQLLTRNIITIRGNKHKLEYAFQKDYDKWIMARTGQHSLPLGVTTEPKKGKIITIRGNEDKNSQSLPLLEKSLPLGVTKSLPLGVNTKEKKETIQKKRDIRHKKKNYFFDNILLTEEEYKKLVRRFGEAGTKDRLENLSLYKKSKGKRYASDYATILAWDKRDKKGGQNGTHRQSPRELRPRESYTKPEDYRT